MPETKPDQTGKKFANASRLESAAYLCAVYL